MFIADRTEEPTAKQSHKLSLKYRIDGCPSGSKNKRRYYLNGHAKVKFGLQQCFCSGHRKTIKESQR